MSLKIVFVIKPVRPTEKRHLKDYLPKNVLAFEDAVIGVEAAQKAEMNIVMVNNMIDFDKVREENTSLGSQNTVFCQTMEDFVPQYWNLPAYEDWIDLFLV